jgi:trigger factor
LPEISVSPPETLSVERPTSSVTETDIDEMIENMRTQRPAFTPVEREARSTDRVLLDYQARMGGKPIEGGDLADVQVVLGTGQAMPELEEGLQGVKAGEQRTIGVVFPAAHPNRKLAGQSAELHLSIKAVEQQSLPEVDQEFFRAYGVEEGGLAEMRAEVRKSMEQELAEVIRGRVRVAVLDALHRGNSIQVPQALVEEQIQQLQLETARRMGIRDASQLPPRDAFVEPARRRVALGLLVAQIVQSQGMKVDRARVQARLAALAESYPNPGEALRAYQQNPEAMRQIESAALEDQVVDWLLERARVTERPMTFTELTGFGRHSHDHEHAHDHEHDHGIEPTPAGEPGQHVEASST